MSKKPVLDCDYKSRCANFKYYKKKFDKCYFCERNNANEVTEDNYEVKPLRSLNCVDSIKGEKHE